MLSAGIGVGVESGAGRALGKKLDVPVDALLRLLEMVSDCWLVFRDLLEVLIRGMNMETKRAPEESGYAPHSKGSPVVGHPATCSLAPRLMRSQCPDTLLSHYTHTLCSLRLPEVEAACPCIRFPLQGYGEPWYPASLRCVVRVGT